MSARRPAARRRPAAPPARRRRGGDGVTALAHVAIAVPDADAFAATLATALGAVRDGEERLEGGALRVVFVRLGPLTLELLEPRAAGHTVARFLAARGPGLHHLSFEVGDLPAALARARAAGVTLVDERPRAGAHGPQVAVLHPRSLGGGLIELCAAPPRARAARGERSRPAPPRRARRRVVRQ